MAGSAGIKKTRDEKEVERLLRLGYRVLKTEDGETCLRPPEMKIIDQIICG